MHGEDKKGQRKEQKAGREKKEIKRRGGKVKEISGRGKKQKRKAKYRDAISTKEEIAKKNKGMGKKQGLYQIFK